MGLRRNASVGFSAAGRKKLEKDLSSAADKLRANSNLKASEYNTPVLGLIFLKLADNKYRQHEDAPLDAGQSHCLTKRRRLSQFRSLRLLRIVRTNRPAEDRSQRRDARRIRHAPPDRRP